MGLPDIKFKRSTSGLGRPLTGSDHISGNLFYIPSSLPAGFASDDRIKKILSIKDAEDLGIVDTHADETVGTGGQVTVTGTWIINEIVRIEIDGASIGQFVLTATTITSLVAGLVAAINAGTLTGVKHGWVAVDNNPIIELTQPAKLGIVNNGGSNLVFVDRNATDTGSSAGGGDTTVQFSGGVGSYFAILHYHISEYFRLQPKGVLFVGLYPQGTYNGDEIRLIQDFSLGEIRQMSVLVTHETFAASQLSATQEDLNQLEEEHKPMSVVFHSDMSATTAAALPNLATLPNQRVSVILGEEGDYHQPAYVADKVYKSENKVTFQGATYIAKADIPVPSPPGDNPGPFDGTKWTFLRENLVAINGFSISVLGATLGVTSFAKVNENIGWVLKFNLVSGTGLDSAGLATGELYESLSVSLRETLNDFHYIFIRKHQGASGTWFSNSWTAVSETNDFSKIEKSRTMDKAVRDIRVFMLPNLLGPVFVNEDGTLTEDTISLFTNDTDRALLAMQIALEISARSVTIDPTQNVLSTGKLIIQVTIVPVGVAEEIEINIGFAVTTTTT